MGIVRITRFASEKSSPAERALQQFSRTRPGTVSDELNSPLLLSGTEMDVHLDRTLFMHGPCSQLVPAGPLRRRVNRRWYRGSPGFRPLRGREPFLHSFMQFFPAVRPAFFWRRDSKTGTNRIL